MSPKSISLPLTLLLMLILSFNSNIQTPKAAHWYSKQQAVKVSWTGKCSDFFFAIFFFIGSSGDSHSQLWLKETDYYLLFTGIASQWSLNNFCSQPTKWLTPFSHLLTQYSLILYRTKINSEAMTSTGSIVEKLILICRRHSIYTKHTKEKGFQLFWESLKKKQTLLKYLQALCIHWLHVALTFLTY